MRVFVITYLSMKAYVCIATKMTRLAKGANSHFFTLGYHYTFAEVLTPKGLGFATSLFWAAIKPFSATLRSPRVFGGLLRLYTAV